MRSLLFTSLATLLGLSLPACGGTEDPEPLPSGDGDSSVVPVPEPGDCEVDEALAEWDSDDLFQQEEVPTFDISLPAERWEYLIAHATEEQWEPVEACYNGKRIGNIALRFKGSYGNLYSCFDASGNLTCPRLSMKLKFSEYDEDLRFFGLKRLNLHANRYDDSRMKEKLAYDLYRAMDVPAPRAGWAVVRVNGESFGLYGMVEELDGRFTDEYWPESPDNNLFKELWPTETNQDDIIAALATNEDMPEVSGFASFAQAVVDAADDAARLEVLDQYMGIEHLARYMAVDDALVSYDGVTYFYTDDGTYSNNHNYYIYEDEPSHFQLVAWDTESTFWINPEHAAPHWTILPEDCSLTYDYWGGLATAPGCDPIFRALHLDLASWRAAAQELLDGPFSEAAMLENINAHEALIGTHARGNDTPTMYANFDSAVDNLRNMIPQMRDRLEALMTATEAQ